MVSIDTYNACVDFPIFDAKSRSLKKAMLSSAGGAIGKNAQNTVVVEALKDINLHLREGDRVGLVGHNGAGKSTLLRLLSGIYEPTRGSADVRGRVAPSLIWAWAWTQRSLATTTSLSVASFRPVHQADEEKDG